MKEIEVTFHRYLNYHYKSSITVSNMIYSLDSGGYHEVSMEIAHLCVLCFSEWVDVIDSAKLPNIMTKSDPQAFW